MKVKPGVTACPHCGGKSGFTTHMRLACTRLNDWTGNSLDTDNFTVLSETRPVCDDCGKSVYVVMDRAAQKGGE